MYLYKLNSIIRTNENAGFSLQCAPNWRNNGRYSTMRSKRTPKLAHAGLVCRKVDGCDSMEIAVMRIAAHACT